WTIVCTKLSWLSTTSTRIGRPFFRPRGRVWDRHATPPATILTAQRSLALPAAITLADRPRGPAGAVGVRQESIRAEVEGSQEGGLHPAAEAEAGQGQPALAGADDGHRVDHRRAVDRGLLRRTHHAVHRRSRQLEPRHRVCVHHLRCGAFHPLALSLSTALSTTWGNVSRRWPRTAGAPERPASAR